MKARGRKIDLRTREGEGRGRNSHGGGEVESTEEQAATKYLIKLERITPTLNISDWSILLKNYDKLNFRIG